MIDQQKKEIRKKIKEKKKQYSLLEKKANSKIIFEKIERLDDFMRAETILVYWSMPDEVFTHDFVLGWYHKKKILLPVVKGNELELKVFSGLENMIKGEQYGIEEPVGEPFYQFEEIDLIIVPGVAFDKKNNRLGRGKAYYDKLLKESKASKVGVCFDFQYLDEVPTDKHDIKMDTIIYN